MKTELKCKECKKEMPKEGLDKNSRPTWFGMWNGDKFVQWICAECWGKGVRYSEIIK